MGFHVIKGIQYSDSILLGVKTHRANFSSYVTGLVLNLVSETSDFFETRFCETKFQHCSSPSVKTMDLFNQRVEVSSNNPISHVKTGLAPV